jgi:hypothetical protein
VLAKCLALLSLLILCAEKPYTLPLINTGMKRARLTALLLRGYRQLLAGISTAAEITDQPRIALHSRDNEEVVCALLVLVESHEYSLYWRSSVRS